MKLLSGNSNRALSQAIADHLDAPLTKAQVKRFADQQKRWDDAGDKAAETGDLVTVDFIGKTLDGVAFEGGTGTDMAVEIGSGRLIPGFEAPAEIPRHLRVSTSGSWVRLDAPFGSVYRSTRPNLLF